jgi:hypothetical protein
MQTTVPLTLENKRAILKWCHENPDADLDGKILQWKKEFNCTEMSICQTFVEEALGQIK